MAKDLQNTSSIGVNTFNKSSVTDVGNIYMPKDSWGHARNAINNSKTGDLGFLGNEPATLFCTELKNSLDPTATPQSYTIIGTIHLEADKWAIFSTDNTSSEIGIFEEGICKYTLVVNDLCLNFNIDNLIKGVSRATGDCVYKLYWDDGINTSRTLTINIEDPSVNVFSNPNSPLPWLQLCYDSNNVYQTSPGVWPVGYNPVGCITCNNLSSLDCDKVRLAHLIDPICASVSKGPGAGTLPNGSYMVAMAYAISGQKISDYYITNVVGLFEHANTASSLEVLIEEIDTDFDEIIVVVVSMVNQQAVARQAGIYSTHQLRLSFDVIDNTWPAIPVAQLPLMTPIVDKTDAMYSVGQYLIRVGTTSKFDFNYQPLANQIRVKWASVEYDSKYYRQAGTNTGYMRDEVYPFFVRWLFNTGDKSSDYHIPGRPPITFNSPSGSALESAPFTDSNSLTGDQKLFETYNTAITSAPGTVTLPDGGVQIREGFMGYWESSEKYPDDKPEIWNPSNPAVPWAAITVPPYSAIGTSAADYDLCGKYIRHHKFPEDNLNPDVNIFNSGTGDKIRIMGVKFENVLPPRDNSGALIPGIIGYEILRGTRNGNKTVVAKGIINNMGLYDIPGGITPRQGAYPNYPYNDLQPDPFLSTTPTSWKGGILSSPGYQNLNKPTSSTYPGFGKFSDTLFTFHSPETNFTDPYLSSKELKAYGEINGRVIGKFDKSEKHPKEKLITDFAFLMAAIGGIGIANLAMNGQKLTIRAQPKTPGYSQAGWTGTAVLYSGTTFTPGNEGAQPTLSDQLAITTSEASMLGLQLAYQGILDAGGATGLNFAGISAEQFQAAMIYANSLGTTTKALPTVGSDLHQEEGPLSRMGPFALFGGIPMFTYFFTEGTDSILEFIKTVVRFRDFALRYHSHGFYNNFNPVKTPFNGSFPSTGQGVPIRRNLQDQQYLGPQLSNFGANIRVNNLYRARTVALQINTDGVIPSHVPIPLNSLGVNDQTRYKVTDVFTPGFLKDPTKEELSFNTPYNIPPNNVGQHQVASSHYVALKQRIKNQYGQLTNIIQVPIPECMTKVNGIAPTVTPVLFGGDVYIGRYTEKNTFFYFYDWLYDQLDGAQLDYHTHEMVANPTYWANFNEFESSDFTTSIVAALAPAAPSGPFFTGPVGAFMVSALASVGITLKLPPTPSSVWAAAVTPADFYCLDGLTNTSYSGSLSTGGNAGALSNFKFSVQNAWFYLFNSGVRDFFVESEINLDYRDYGNTEAEVHYDPLRYTDTKSLFDTSIIKAGNHYKYDQSLSISKLFFNYASWGNTQSRQYDPFLAETCYQYRPRRVIYSLPAVFEGKRDNWLIFLANNYYDFLSNVTSIKPVNKNGAVILFDSASPVEFQGTDQLQTSLGVKLTIGDGGLFSQPMQQLTNSDRPYEYGSCQNRLSVINTPLGLFYMSQNQGKIFHLTNSLQEISGNDWKWWFAQYLPYKLTEFFPDFTLVDNPITGIGCQSIYDNENGLVYFCKRDYILQAGYTASAQYDPITNPNPTDGNIGYNPNTNVFIYLPTQLPIKLTDVQYFEDASWTVSYDPKTKGWIGGHDWHPELLLPGKNTFMSTYTDPISKRGGIWIHNKRCDLYCNYYGVDYPFEIEYMVNTPQQITTLRSIEYYMEVYKYDANCHDRFHVLDYNFDEVVIYNTEQCSGLLRLNPSPRLDPGTIIQYPIINPTNIDILYSKVENKYRFNQFWDITDDRGEFPLYPLPPVAQRMIWNTGANGYVKALNLANLNYNKAELQRKKFRHYTNSVFLRKRVIAGQQIKYKILVMITDNKQLYSSR